MSAPVRWGSPRFLQSLIRLFVLALRGGFVAGYHIADLCLALRSGFTASYPQTTSFC